MANLTDMLSKFMSSTTASSSGSGTLPSNTISNPKEDLKGPKSPSPSKQGTKVTKDHVQTTSSQSTAPVQPSVIQSESQDPISEPVVAPVGAPMPNSKPSIPYPSRRDNEKRLSKPLGIAKDVSFKVGVFHFSADFVVVDFEPDPRVPLILGRCFLKTSRALIDVYKGELTLCIRNEAITYNLDQTEADAFLGLEDDHDSPKINPFYYDPEGDILLLETILNSKPSPPPPNQEQDLPSFKEELKAYEAQTVKSSVDEPPEVELWDLPPHLEYVFLEDDNKLPVIIAKELGDEEKSALIKVLKSHKRAIAWKLSDIQGINLEFCTHKILMEEDYKPAVQHQRWVNLKIHDVIKKEVEKLLDAGLIYPISD
nr:hypothetical protein [Tanacetum cinerariifolium]